MYRVKSDRRIIQSADLVVKGLHTCLATKNYNELNVSEVIKASTVSRSTFYRIFDSLSDVLAYETNQMFASLNHQINNQISATTILLLDIKIFMEHAILLEALINNQKINILYDAQLKYIHDNNLFEDAKYMNALDHDMLLSNLTYLLVSALTTWIKNGKQHTSEDILASLTKSIHLISNKIVNKDLKS